MALERYIDLHTHSTKSDGSMTPAEVVREAKEKGLAAIALSDHDGIDGLREAMLEGERIGVEVVPAIELSVQSDTETHILGYYIDIENRELIDELEKAKRVRDLRAVGTCEKLNQLGFDISMDEVRAIAPPGLVARAHFAKVMADKGYVASVKEAFTLWLDNGRPAYNNTQYFSPEEGIRLIKAAGGLAFVAHLHLIRLDDEAMEAFLRRLMSVGLDGIEGYYTDYTKDMEDTYQRMARRLGLAISGGTDFHAAMKPHIGIGVGLGNLRIPYSLLENIKALKGQIKN